MIHAKTHSYKCHLIFCIYTVLLYCKYTASDAIHQVWTIKQFQKKQTAVNPQTMNKPRKYDVNINISVFLNLRRIIFSSPVHTDLIFSSAASFLSHQWSGNAYVVFRPKAGFDHYICQLHKIFQHIQFCVWTDTISGSGSLPRTLRRTRNQTTKCQCGNMPIDSLIVTALNCT